MSFTVGHFMDPRDETDEPFDDFDTAYERLTQQADETENLVVGIWEEGNDYATHVAINGEIFRAE